METKTQPISEQTRTRSPTRTTSPTRTRRSPSPTKIRSRGQVDIRQNFSQEVEDEINNLIHLLMVGGYQCIAMAAFFDRDDVGLFGMAHFSKWTSTEIYQLARLMMDYLVVRGGRVRLQKIDKPRQTEFKSPQEGLELLITMQDILYDQVLKIHTIAGKAKDGHLNDFLESVALRPLVTCNRQLVVLQSNLIRAGPTLGEYQFNKHLEKFLKSIINDPNLSHFAHGGTDYLNMYQPQPNTPIDFSSILVQMINQIPEISTQLDVSDLINLVGRYNIGSLIKPFKKTYL